ncbi:MAG: hypothetical protein Q6359_09160 [Candidatus Brocadiales bacterium]|nr:hypothetical protein [Candidatus Brocadiales bacterium]
MGNAEKDTPLNPLFLEGIEFGIPGLTDSEREEVYRVVMELVRQRLEKARSMKVHQRHKWNSRYSICTVALAFEAIADLRGGDVKLILHRYLA